MCSLVALLLSQCVCALSVTVQQATIHSTGEVAVLSKSNFNLIRAEKANGPPPNCNKHKTATSTAPSLQYFTAADHSTLPAECAKYNFSDLGTKVPDSCCAAGGVIQTGSTPTWTHNGEDYTCAPQDAGQIGWIRDFLGCVDGKVTFGEACVPSGSSFGSGYPMTAQAAASLWSKAADAGACGCGNISDSSRIPTVYSGPGCYVAVTTYMLQPESGSKEAFFAKVSGSC